MLVSSSCPIYIRQGWCSWVSPPVTKTTDRCGSVCFIIYWNRNPPESVTVRLGVSKDGYEREEDIVLGGNRLCYAFKHVCNGVPPPPGVPELGLTTPVITSIVAATYFGFKKRREKSVQA